MIGDRRSWMMGTGAVVAIVSLTGCAEVEVAEYEAIAVTRYVWQVEYNRDTQQDRPADRRLETFAETSLENINGQEPGSAVTGPDDRELWWPALPPRPTLDEMEARQQGREAIGTPELQTQVDYELRYDVGGRPVSKPTDFAVYRQAVKALRQGQALRLTLGVDDSTVEKAEPIP